MLAQLSHTRPLYASYLRIRSLSPSPTNPELLSALGDLRAALSTLSDDLSDLVDSVRAIEADPYAFGLETEEVVRRQRLVDEVGGEVEDMREELAGRIREVDGKAGNGSANASAKTRYAANDNAAESARPDGDDGDAYAAFEHQQQLATLSAQDEQLDSVFHTVGNLRLQADEMGRELEEQAEMLEVVDGLADRVGGRLQVGMQKMNYVIRKNEDAASSCCIAVLIFVLILLLVLVLVL